MFLPNIPVKTGIPKSSDGTLNWAIPTNTGLINETTRTFATNTVVYVPIFVSYLVTLNAWEFEVTSAPASNANVTIGIYNADQNLQPLGSPVYDSGSIAVASGFTGVKKLTGLSVIINPGVYLVAMNVDTIMTLRTFNSVSYFIQDGIGTGSLLKRFTAVQTLGAYPTPGTQWVEANFVTDVLGLQHFVFWQWT